MRKLGEHPKHPCTVHNPCCKACRKLKTCHQDWEKP